MEKIKNIFLIVLLSAFLSLIITNYIIRIVENHQIKDIINITNNVIYQPKLEIEKLNIRSNSPQLNKQLQNIYLKYSEIMSISFIQNNKFVYNTNTDIKKEIPKYITEIINKKIKNIIVNDPLNSNKVNFIFKSKYGYYMISFYRDLINDPIANYITNFKVINLADYRKTPYLFHYTSYHLKDLNIIIISGIMLKKLITLSLIIFSFVLIILIIIKLSFNIHFDAKKIFIRRLKKSALNKEFIPYYQSIYSLKEKKYVSAEVLCRWKNNGKIISPSEFIYELEKTNEIKTVTLHLIKEAFFTLQQSNVDEHFKLSFNFTVNMMLDNIFMKEVIDFVKENKSVKGNIIIELTESENSFLHLNEMKNIMLRLKKVGILLSTDDVGTGYSNLVTIQELPFDIMKIDQCFISSKFAASNSNMLELLTSLGNSMNLKIVAEGIETKLELDKVINFNIDLCQGFYFSTPCDSHSFLLEHQ